MLPVYTWVCTSKQGQSDGLSKIQEDPEGESEPPLLHRVPKSGP